MSRQRLLTAAEVAERLRTSAATVVRACRAGDLPATKPLGTWLIAEDDLDAYIEARRNTAA